MSFSAIILAGGESRRMGRDKAFLEKDGLTLVRRAVKVAQEAGAGEVMLSGRPAVDYGVALPVLLDLEPGLGPMSGIERGLSSATNALVMVLAVDMPEMESKFVRRLAEACQEEAGAVPIVNGKIEPLAAYYPKGAHALAMAALRSGRRSVTAFAQQCVESGLAVPYRVRAEEERFFVNWNYREKEGPENRREETV